MPLRAPARAAPQTALRTSASTSMYDAGEIAAGPIEAGDKSGRHRVGGTRNTMGIFAVAALAARIGECTAVTTITATCGHQFGRHGRQPFVLAVRPAVFDRDVPALDIAGLAQTLAERAPRWHVIGQSIRCGETRSPASPAAARAPRAATAAAPPRRLMNSRRRISAPKLRGQHCIGSNEYFDRGQPGIKTIGAVHSQCRGWVITRLPLWRSHVRLHQEVRTFRCPLALRRYVP